jgi:hypothetical protein
MTVVARRRLAWRGARRSLSFMIGLALLAFAANHGGVTAPAPRDTTVVSVAAAPVAGAPSSTDATGDHAVADAAVEVVPVAPLARPVPRTVTALVSQAAVATSGPRAPPARSA